MNIIKKEVSFLELFYDLLFVFAISQLTMLISEPVNGFIALDWFFSYIINSIIIFQAWLYFTIYINRFSQWRWYDYLFTFVNMAAVIYSCCAIFTGSDNSYLSFAISLFALFGSILMLNLIHSYVNKEDRKAALNSIMIVGILTAIYGLCAVGIYLNVIDEFFSLIAELITIILGLILPFIFKNSYNEEFINFPHLVERFELLTIITFGESIIAVTSYVNTSNFNITPILVLSLILIMFAFYIINIQHLMDHYRKERGFRLIFTHYFIILAINLMTVTLELFHNTEANFFLTSVLLVVSLIIFIFSVLANKTYYSEGITLTKKDILLCIISIIIGSAIIFLASSSLTVLLIGAVVMCGGSLLAFYSKFNQVRNGISNL